MMRTSQIGLLAALLIVLAITVVLITPDPTDDIAGILRPQKIVKLLLVAALVIPTIVQLAEGPYVESNRIVISRDLFRYICAYRC